MNYIEVIKNNIKIDQMINNWSKAGKIKVNQYRFKGVASTCNKCYLENPLTKKVYTVTEKDFTFLEKYWKSYKEERISRHELRDLNQSTTYTICLMHYLELNNYI